MKKKGILNSEISKEISQLGHTDKIMIADCGLPIPQDVRRIDISLKAGTPSFYDVYKVLKEELIIEKQFLAKEIKNENKQLHNFIKNDFETEYLSHEQLKDLSKQCKFILRTGEMTPYANVILQSGVNFEEIYEHTSY